MLKTGAVPSPGSREAVFRGCTCPIIDNHHGDGWSTLPGEFIITAGCPLHWPVGGTLGPFVAVKDGSVRPALAEHGGGK